MEQYRLYVRRGQYLTELNDAPSFADKAKGEAYAARYTVENPGLVKRGVEAIDVRQPSSIAANVLQGQER